jgi:hypothetical protein
MGSESATAWIPLKTGIASQCTSNAAGRGPTISPLFGSTGGATEQFGSK